MKSIFPGHFTSSSLDFRKLWSEALIVVDTNVLLDLYRYSEATREELIRILESLADRMWIPHQVAHEYLNKRLNVIAEQSKSYSDQLKKIEEFKKPLELEGRHPFISSSLLDECRNLFIKIESELRKSQDVHDNKIVNDEIKRHLETLLEGKVGQGYDKARLEEIIKSGDERYKENIPPGFKDADKAKNALLFSEKLRPYGDYIIWLQMIDCSIETKKPLIFVTNDSKSDWWQIFNGKTIGPNPELIHEFQELTSNNIYMYSVGKFLDAAGDHLNQKASEESIKEVKEFRSEDLVKADLETFDDAVQAAWEYSKGSQKKLTEFIKLNIKNNPKFKNFIPPLPVSPEWKRPDDSQDSIDELVVKLKKQDAIQGELITYRRDLIARIEAHRAENPKDSIKSFLLSEELNTLDSAIKENESTMSESRYKYNLLVTKRNLGLDL